MLLSLWEQYSGIHNLVNMKLSKSLLQAMLIAVTAGTIISCEKPKVDEGKKPTTENSKAGNELQCCPACGMG